jgi:hypothetical protein
MKLLILLMFIITVGLSCNREGGGYRENQEEATRPTDYTSGKDVKKAPNAPAERSPEEQRETPSQNPTH